MSSDVVPVLEEREKKVEMKSHTIIVHPLIMNKVLFKERERKEITKCKQINGRRGKSTTFRRSSSPDRSTEIATTLLFSQ